MDWATVIISVAGGISLLLFGLEMLSRSLKRAAGEQMKRLLERLTDRPYKGVLAGAVTAGVMQSSSMTMVALIGLINAGIITLKQAVGVMLGGEIGTTVTAQIVAFDVGPYYLVALATGFVLWAGSKSQKWKNAGEAILSFGIMFLGMTIMTGSLKYIGDEPFVAQTLASYAATPYLGIIFGAIATALIHSSAAVTVLVVALGKEGVIALPAAIAIILGANIGTTVTGAMVSSTSCSASRRLSVCQILVNTIGVLAFAPFILPFSSLVAMTSTELPRQIANAHSIFNITVTIAMLPFVGALVWLSGKVIRGRESRTEETVGLDEKLLKIPSVAVQSAKAEMMKMAAAVSSMLKDSEAALLRRGKARDVMAREEFTDRAKRALDGFLSKLPAQQLSESDAARVHAYQHAITDLERIGDHAVNICELGQIMVEKGARLSPQAAREAEAMFKAVTKTLSTSVRALREEDQSLVEKVREMESATDRMEREYKRNHIKRLERGVCDPTAGVAFVEVLRNLERVGDHAMNIGGDVMFLKRWKRRGGAESA